LGHHFVPQRYLENFEDTSQAGFIWLHDKRGGPARLARIDKVVQAKRFYSTETETRLTREVEVPANAVIEKLIGDTAITPVERLQLAYYIGVMMKRVPARRRHATEMIPGVLADVVEKVRGGLKATAIAMQADPELLAQRLRDVDVMEVKFASEPPPEVVSQIREPWPSEAMLRALFEMTWRVLVSAGPQYFITSDNPAFFFREYGLGREESELSFPLSTTHALHGSWKTAGSDLVFLGATQALVKEVNRRLASEAERLAFYHEPAPWLLAILPKKKPHLSVIRWQNESTNNRFHGRR
jgi:hypothetical protein